MFLTSNIKTKYWHFFSENSSAKYYASPNLVSSLPSCTNLQCLSLSIILYLTTPIWLLSFMSSKFLGPTQMSSYLNLQLSRHSNGHILVHAQWAMIPHVRSSAQTVIASKPHLQKSLQIQMWSASSAQSALGRINTVFLLALSGARENLQGIERREELGYSRLRNLIWNNNSGNDMEVS